MQRDDYKIEQIINKYKYLYNNRELILASSIKKDESDNYYLDKDMDSDMIISIKNFLLDDCNINQTDLYSYIEFVRKNSFYYPFYEDYIKKIKEQRKLNIYLRNIPTFSVWKILENVRKWYYDDEKVLNELDIYYNIERFVLTGIDWNSGYYLNKLDLYDKYEYINMFPSTFIIARGDFLDNGEFTIFNYCGNSYEEEDNYYAFDSSKSALKNILDVSFKKKIYEEINSSKIKKYIK